MQRGWTAEGSVVCTLTKEASLCDSQPSYFVILASCTWNVLDAALVCALPQSAAKRSKQAKINNSTCGSLTISEEHFKYLMRVCAEATRLTIWPDTKALTFSVEVSKHQAAPLTWMPVQFTCTKLSFCIFRSFFSVFDTRFWRHHGEAERCAATRSFSPTSMNNPSRFRIWFYRDFCA